MKRIRISGNLGRIIVALLVAALVAGGVFAYCRYKARPVEAPAAKQEVKADSLCLNVICSPTLESLPLYYAVESGITKRLGLPLAITTEKSQLAIDSLFRTAKLCDAAVLDSYRLEHYRQQKCPLQAEELFRLDGRWGLASSSQLRIREKSQMKKRIVADARFSTSAHCLETSLHGTDVKVSQLYVAQINDYEIRLSMLENAEVEASLLPEPFFAQALARGHRNLWVGDSITSLVFCERKGLEKNEIKKKQIELLLQAYNTAVEELNAGGPQKARATLVKYYALSPEIIAKLHLPHYHTLPQQ